MADLNLTETDDEFEYDKGKNWVNIFGLSGKDKIIIHGNANVLGGPGDDIIINDVFSWIGGGVAYWNSPASIYVDLEAGYALDGFGTRDTLVNFRSVTSSGHDGDVILGTSKSDELWANGFNWGNRSPGSMRADLRGGVDTVSIHGSTLQNLKVDVAADGKTVTLTAQNGYSGVFSNVEVLRFKQNNNGVESEQIYNVQELIDFSKVGPATLIEKRSDGWSNGSPKALTFSFMSAAPAYGGGEGGVVLRWPMKRTKMP